MTEKLPNIRRLAWALTESSSCQAQAAVTRYRYGGASLVSTVSWQSSIPRQQLTIFAERGTLIFDDKAERKLTLCNLQRRTSYPHYDDELPLTRELRAFLDTFRSGSTDRTHIGLGTSIVRAISAAEASINAGGVTVEILT